MKFEVGQIWRSRRGGFWRVKHIEPDLSGLLRSVCIANSEGAEIYVYSNGRATKAKESPDDLIWLVFSPKAAVGVKPLTTDDIGFLDWVINFCKFFLERDKDAGGETEKQKRPERQKVDRVGKGARGRASS